MISKWKVALISSAWLAAVLVEAPDAAVIHSVSYSGARAISASELASGSLLARGSAYTDSLAALEVSRVDSVYFSRGRLGVSIEVDTVSSGDGIDVRLSVSEGDVARIGAISVDGAKFVGDEEVEKTVRPGAGSPFDPFELRRSLERILAVYNESGYPYAQVWLTGFTYRAGQNEIDIAISVSEGEESKISRVVFEGIAKTDSAVALRMSRLAPGSRYREGSVAIAGAYLRGAGWFESVGAARLERRPGGAVDVIFPVKEASRANLFQGALGFSRKTDGKYVLNGSLQLALSNIAGTGRNARFDWLNDGEKYSKIELSYREPFLFSTRLNLDAELRQVIQDTIYQWHSGGVYLRFPLGPSLAIVAGAAGDRNVPGAGELVRSVRERFRLGIERETPSEADFTFYVEGAHRKSDLEGGRSERDGEILYRFDAGGSIPSFGEQSAFVRVASEGVFSTGSVPLAETFPLGGATSLRGYRENQFRGEKVAFVNIEYRFGEGGWLFLFDDLGAFYRPGAGWTGKNGAGFGLRSESQLGIVSLSFGVGEELSLEGTRIHISLAEKF